MNELLEMSNENLGFLYELQAYIHKDKGFLCRKPNEDSIKASEPIRTQKELADLLGVTQYYISQKVRTMKIGNMAVFVQTKCLGKTRFYVNPKICFKGL